MEKMIVVLLSVSSLMTILSILNYRRAQTWEPDEDNTRDGTILFEAAFGYLIFSVFNLLLIVYEYFKVCNGELSAFSAFPYESFSPVKTIVIIVLLVILFLISLIICGSIKSKDKGWVELVSYLISIGYMLWILLGSIHFCIMTGDWYRWESILNWKTPERYEQIKICPEIENFATYEFSLEQLKEVRLGLEARIDVTYYSNICFNAEQMREIRLGLEDGLNVRSYAKSEFDSQQMKEIRLGLEKGLNARFYADPKFDHKQMRELRLGLEAGININQYADPNMDWHEMYMKRMSLTQNEGEKE